MKDLKVSMATAGRCTDVKNKITEYLQQPHHVMPRLNLGDFALPGDLALEKSAFVLARPGRDELNLNDELGVEFAPSSAPEWFPRFRGVLDLFPGERPDETIVELTGSYDPPFGAAGHAFDAALGHLIAQRSMRSFLQEIVARANDPHTEFQHVND